MDAAHDHEAETGEACSAIQHRLATTAALLTSPAASQDTNTGTIINLMQLRDAGSSLGLGSDVMDIVLMSAQLEFINDKLQLDRAQAMAAIQTALDKFCATQQAVLSGRSGPAQEKGTLQDVLVVAMLQVLPAHSAADCMASNRAFCALHQYFGTTLALRQSSGHQCSDDSKTCQWKSHSGTHVHLLAGHVCTPTQGRPLL